MMDREKLIEVITGEVIQALEQKARGESSTQRVFRSANTDILGSRKPFERQKGGDDPQPDYDQSLAAMIDHTQLRPECTRPEVEQLCEEARKYRFYSVCVNSSWVLLCASLLRGSGVKICSVVGFPLGAMDSRTKAFETRQAVADGATEIDMVINVGALKGRDYVRVESDIRAVVQAAGRRITKVILETALLSDEEKVLGCKIAMRSGASFVKTSTGFSKGGATPEDVRLMRETVGPKLGVKASGGVRTRADATRVIEAGANRIGASSSVAIVTGGTGEGY